MSAGYDDEQWSRPCLAFSEASSEAGHLRLIVALPAGEGVCDVFVEEHADRIAIEVLACPDPARGPALPSDRADVFLTAPLGGRRVIDAPTGRAIPRREA